MEAQERVWMKKIQRMGESVGITLPPLVLRALNAELGDYLTLTVVLIDDEPVAKVKFGVKGARREPSRPRRAKARTSDRRAPSPEP